MRRRGSPQMRRHAFQRQVAIQPNAARVGRLTRRQCGPQPSARGCCPAAFEAHDPLRWRLSHGRAASDASHEMARARGVSDGPRRRIIRGRDCSGDTGRGPAHDARRSRAVGSQRTASCAQRGAIEPPDDVIDTMRWAYPASFVAMAMEGAWAGPASADALAAGLAVFGFAKALKIWAITTLGVRWTFRVLVLPDAPLIDARPVCAAPSSELRGGAGRDRRDGVDGVGAGHRGPVVSSASAGCWPADGRRRSRARETIGDAHVRPARLSERFPWWARALDIITVAASCSRSRCSSLADFANGRRVGRLSVTSWIRPLVLALVCADRPARAASAADSAGPAVSRRRSHWWTRIGGALDLGRSSLPRASACSRRLSRGRDDWLRSQHAALSHLRQ